jgi:mutator protein MutT
MEEIVGALLIQSNRILLGQRSPERRFYPGVWDVFGGHVEAGESKKQALLRELQEELGIQAQHWVQVETLLIPDYLSPSQSLGLDLFRVTEWFGTPENRQAHEHIAIDWFTLEQALKLDLAFAAYREIFKRYLFFTI